KTVAEFTVRDHTLRLLAGTLPGTRVPVWLVDCPELYDRSGNPYLGPDGKPWPDNAWRYTLFAEAVVQLASNQLGLDWQPNVVHCNDWQSGLIPALLSRQVQRPATVFTIHNLAYQGTFPYQTFQDLGLSPDLWHLDALEYHGQLSFIKGGLVFADRINTVSPSYAREIQTPEFGYGLDGLLRHRHAALSGILNGIDIKEWNPGTDSFLAETYNRRSLANKLVNKSALQQNLGLDTDADTLLIGFVGRLVEQKGVDILLDGMKQILSLPLQLAMLGSGEAQFETTLLKTAKQHAGRVAVKIGYSESLAHQIEAGADVFLMPSRFEPCGLNQMYSMRYGTPPVVRSVGGLTDTVNDASEANLSAKTATGFVFSGDQGRDLYKALARACHLYHDKTKWKSVQLTGMGRDFSWHNSAQEYLKLYNAAIRDNPTA
ncbi:MAG: glycogen synthase GlgA, partial [Halobacteria archaeon]|nr:glycogen synthase GlgA [Halobacteria archaeon]